MAQNFLSTPGGNLYPDPDTDYDQSEAWRITMLRRDAQDAGLKAQIEQIKLSSGTGATLEVTDELLSSILADDTSDASTLLVQQATTEGTALGGGLREVFATQTDFGPVAELVAAATTDAESITRTNLSLNSRALAGSTQWNGYLGTGGKGSMGPEPTATGPDGLLGVYRVKWDTQQSGGTRGINSAPGVPLTPKPGQYITVSAWFKASAAVTLNFGGGLRSGGTYEISAPYINQTLQAGVWTRRSWTLKSGTGAADNIYWAAYLPGADVVPAGMVIDATQVLIELADQLRPYYDGDTPATVDRTYRWTGTPHASMSLELSSLTLAKRDKYGNIAVTTPLTASAATPKQYVDQAVEAFSVNVMAFGAKGDGVTDDTAVVQTAVNYLKLRGGGTLLFPAGRIFRLGGAVELCSNLKVSARGATLKKTGTVDSYSVFVSKSNGATGYGSGIQNVVFDGGTYEGSFTGTITGIAVTLHHARHIQFSNVTFTESSVSGHSIDLGGCDDVLIENSVFKGWLVQSGREYVEAIQVDYSTRTGMPVETADSSYDGLPTINVTVRGCQFLPLEKGGVTYPAPNPMGNHNRVENRWIENILFENNIVTGCRKTDDLTAGVAGYFNGWLHFFFIRGIKVAGNTFTNTTSKASTVVAIQTPSTATPLSAVAVDGAASVDVMPLPATNVLVENNTFTGFNSATAEDIILVTGNSSAVKSRDVKVRGNTITGSSPKAFETYAPTGQVFLRLSQVRDVEMSGNNFNGVFQPLYAYGVAGLQISANTVADNSGIFGQVDACSRVRVIGNNARYAGGLWIRNTNLLTLLANEFESFNSTTGDVIGVSFVAINGCKNISVRDNHFSNLSGNTWITSAILVYETSQVGKISDSIILGTFSSKAVDISSNSSSVVETGTVVGVA